MARDFGERAGEELASRRRTYRNPSDFVDASELSDVLTGMQSVDVFSALANPIRRDILVRLKKGPSSVTDLATGFDVGRPAISEHLQVLRAAKLVREEQRGRERHYHLDPRPLEGVSTWIEAFSKYWTRRLDDLEALLDREKEKNR